MMFQLNRILCACVYSFPFWAFISHVKIATLTIHNVMFRTNINQNVINQKDSSPKWQMVFFSKAHP